MVLRTLEGVRPNKHEMRRVTLERKERNKQKKGGGGTPQDFQTTTRPIAKMSMNTVGLLVGLIVHWGSHGKEFC